RPCPRCPRCAGPRAWRARWRSSPASVPLPRSHRLRTPSAPPSLRSGPIMSPLGSAAARLALVEAAGDALLAAFLVDERGLAAFAAEIADLPPLRARLLGRRLPLPHVLAQRARQRVGKREDPGRAGAGWLAPT